MIAREIETAVRVRANDFVDTLARARPAFALRETQDGTAAQVGTQQRALAAELQLDELVVNTWAHDPAVRRHSYALLAEQFGLAGA